MGATAGLFHNMFRQTPLNLHPPSPAGSSSASPLLVACRHARLPRRGRHRGVVGNWGGLRSARPLAPIGKQLIAASLNRCVLIIGHEHSQARVTTMARSAGSLHTLDD